VSFRLSGFTFKNKKKYKQMTKVKIILGIIILCAVLFSAQNIKVQMADTPCIPQMYPEIIEKCTDINTKGTDFFGETHTKTYQKLFALRYCCYKNINKNADKNQQHSG
jgi:hypothetical protein